jgi:hypothetical protein
MNPNTITGPIGDQIGKDGRTQCRSDRKALVRKVAKKTSALCNTAVVVMTMPLAEASVSIITAVAMLSFESEIVG